MMGQLAISHRLRMGSIKAFAKMGAIRNGLMMGTIKLIRKLMGIATRMKSTGMELIVSKPEMMMPLLITTPLRLRVRSQLPTL